MGQTVVGVDGSEPSVQALRWALADAAAHGHRVRAVYAYDYDPAWSVYAYAEGGVAAPSPEDMEAWAEDARRKAETLLERAQAQASDLLDGVELELVAVPNRRAASALVDEAAEADLLVVGSRGRGGFVGLLLGSVSHQVATHARCPVVIVPTRQE